MKVFFNRFLCLFLPSSWLHLVNATMHYKDEEIEVGIYTCSRCYQIKLGLKKEDKSL